VAKVRTTKVGKLGQIGEMLPCSPHQLIMAPVKDGDGTFASENFKLKHDRPGLVGARG